MMALKRIFKNSIFLITGRIISIILSMVFSIYAARKIGTLDFGRFSFIISLTGYFLLFSGAELQNLLVRDISYQKHSSNEYLTTAIVFKLIVSCISIILIVLLTKFIGKFQLLIPITIAAISLIPSSIYDAFDAVFRGYEKMEYIAIAGIVYSILRTGIGILLISLGVTLTGLFIGLLLVEVCKALLIFLFHSRHINLFYWQFSRKILKYLFQESYILILIKGGLGLFYYRADIILLAALVGDASVGQFTVSANLAGLFTMVSAIAISTFLPVISQRYYNNRDKMIEFLRILFKYTLSIFIPLILFFNLFSKAIIQFFYGKEYLASASVLTIVIWSALFSTLLGVQGTLLLVSNQYRSMARIYILVTIMKIVFSYWLIEKFGLMGAAIGYSLSDGLALLSYHFYARREFKGIIFGSDLFKILFASIIFIIVFYLAKPIGSTISFALSLSIYMLGLFLIKVFSFKELKFAAAQTNLKLSDIK